MTAVYKIKYLFGSADDDHLTISPDDLPLLPSFSSYNFLIDLTINKSQHLPGSKSRKYWDESKKKQISFLTQCYIDIVERHNVFSRDKIISGLIKYEVQPGTFNIHTHGTFRVSVNTSEENVQANLIDIIKGLGFDRRGISVQGIKSSDAREAYVMKRRTTYDTPFRLIHAEQ